MHTPTTVTELNNQIKAILETTFSVVSLEGEVSNLTYHSSGHIYFSVKDKSATLSCVMFKGNAQHLKFRLEVGAKIVIRGNITVYAPRGNYQILCQHIEPSGVGALSLAYEQLKTKLQIQGYFDKSHKKELSLYPQTIYVITSSTGAAIEDMKKILSVRYPLAKMILLPTTVQGESAKESIVVNIQKANRLALDTPNNSFLIIGRGGGSIEDLWAFNEESVCDAIYQSTLPIVSAVGHENDFVLSDFVADKRASTPSNAIEISTPNRNDLRQYADGLMNDMNHKYKTLLLQKKERLYSLGKNFEQHSFAQKFLYIESTIVNLKQQFKRVITQNIQGKFDRIDFLEKSFHVNHPKNRDKKGYVQLSRENKIVALDQLNQDDFIALENSKVSVVCRVVEKKKIFL